MNQRDDPAGAGRRPPYGNAPPRMFATVQRARAFVAACVGLSIVFPLAAFLAVREVELSAIDLGLLGIPAATCIVATSTEVV